MLGYSQYGPADLYRITVPPRTMLSLQTQTPGAIAGEPANVLDPRLRLLSANGTPIAFDDDSGGDHRNASIIYFTPAGSSPASYIVEVSSQTPFAPYGTYLLKMSGQNVDPQPFTATAVSPVAQHSDEDAADASDNLLQRRNPTFDTSGIGPDD